METCSLFDMEARLLPATAAKPVAQFIPVTELAAVPAQPVAIRVEAGPAALIGTNGTGDDGRFSTAKSDALYLTPTLPTNPTNSTLTSPRPNGFPSPPRYGFPTRDVRFAHRGPLPCEGSGEGDESTVQEINARDSSRSIPSPYEGEAEKQVVRGFVGNEQKVAPCADKPKSVVQPATSARRTLLADLVAIVNPVAGLRKRGHSGNGRSSKPPRTAVQTELSLEKVKVVRNDLNETDLEVIAARPAPKIDKNVVRSACEQRSAAEPTVLSRLTSRFFRQRPAQAR
jgi:hypothetical protein